MLINSQRVARGMVGNLDSIEISGPFDFNDPQIDLIATQIIEEGKNSLAFDFSKVTYVTSPGIACIVKVLKKIQSANGLLCISNATADMRDLFRLAHIDRFIKFM
jgi:anti-anti-sigma factor